jgi:hypothetical protein
MEAILVIKLTDISQVSSALLQGVPAGNFQRDMLDKVVMNRAQMVKPNRTDTVAVWNALCSASR